MAKTATSKSSDVEIGRNVTYSVNGNILTVTMDMSAKAEESASGKTLIVATTSGNKLLPNTNGFILGINAYRYKDKKGK
jgi:hypothetical protein